MSNKCDFDRILKTECNLQHFTRNCRIKNLGDFERDEIDAFLWKAGLLNVKKKGMTICCIMKRCLVMFLRGGNVNFVEYYEQVSTLQMAELLKTRNINVVPGQLFSCQCKAKFLLETDCMTVLMIKMKFNPLQILTMNSLNVKHQWKSSNEKAYTRLWKL